MADTIAPAPAPAGLPGAWFLLRAAWARLLDRWKTLVLVTVVQWVLMFVVTGLTVGGVLVLVVPAVTVWLSRSASFDLASLAPAFPVVALGLLVLWVVSLAGSAAQMLAAGADQAVPFGAAVGHGIRRIGPMLGVFLLPMLIALPLALTLLLVIIVPFIRAGLPAANGAGANIFPAGLGPALLLLPVLFVIFFYVGLRLSFALLLVALGEAGVFAAFRESWRLTRGRFWALVWRLIALGLAVTIVMLPVSLLESGVQLAAGERGLAVGAVGVINLVVNAIATLFGTVYGVVLLRWTQHVAGTRPA